MRRASSAGGSVAAGGAASDSITPSDRRRQAARASNAGARSQRVAGAAEQPLSAGPVERLVDSLFACVLFLAILFLWHLSYARSCVVLVLPVLAWLAIFNGLLQSRLERRRFALTFFLDRRAWLYRRLRHSWLSVLISLSMAGLLAAFLVVFVARSRPTDWYFLCAAAATAPLLFHVLSTALGPQLRQDPGDGGLRAPVADILVVRMAGTLLLVGLALLYVCVNYYVVPVPPGIDPDSLERTLEAFTAGARSACPLVEDVLLIATQLEGLSWYLVATATTSTGLPDEIESVRWILWVAFFLNAAMVFGGFTRGLEGSILLARRAAARHRNGGAHVHSGP